MKKILFALSFVFVSLFGSFSVSASTEYPPYPNSYNKYFLITKDSSSGNIFLIGSDDFNSERFTTAVGSSSNIYLLSDGVWVKYHSAINYYFSMTSDFEMDFSQSYSAVNSLRLKAISSSDNSYFKSVYGDDFFPVPLGPVTEAVQGIQLGGVMATVLEVIPIVVLSIVSFLALRKAFHWLSLQLKGC